jgi:hypothetical protein
VNLSLHGAGVSILGARNFGSPESKNKIYLSVDPGFSPEPFQPLSSKVERNYFGTVDIHLWSLQFVFTNKYLPSVLDYDTTIY